LRLESDDFEKKCIFMTSKQGMQWKEFTIIIIKYLLIRVDDDIGMKLALECAMSYTHKYILN
jgi:hypothetical protein